MKDLLAGPPRVVNVGLARFAADLRGAGVEVAEVEWSPPAAGPDALALADQLEADGAVGERIDAANREAVDRMLRGDPVLVDVLPPARPCPVSATGSSSTPGRRSNGTGCAARCGGRRRARQCSKGGRGTSTRRRRSRPGAASNSRPTTTTTRWGR